MHDSAVDCPEILELRQRRMLARSAGEQAQIRFQKEVGQFSKTLRADITAMERKK
jgi:hypothetical protein